MDILSLIQEHWGTVAISVGGLLGLWSGGDIIRGASPASKHISVIIRAIKAIALLTVDICDVILDFGAKGNMSQEERLHKIRRELGLAVADYKKVKETIEKK